MTSWILRQFAGYLLTQIVCRPAVGGDQTAVFETTLIRVVATVPMSDVQCGRVDPVVGCPKQPPAESGESQPSPDSAGGRRHCGEGEG